MDKVDAYLDAVFNAFTAAGRIVPWPIHIATIFPYFCDLEAAELFERLRSVAPQGREAVARLHVNSSVAKALLMDLVPALKEVPGVSKADRCWLVETVLDSLEVIDHGDIFCRDGRYRKMTDAQVTALSGLARWSLQANQPVVCRAAYRLSAAAQALIWSLFFYGWTDVAFEIHGPYRVNGQDGQPRDLVVREFFDLRPLPVWSELENDATVESVMLLAEMKVTANSRVDIFNHLTHRGNLHEQTTAVAVFLNGAPVADAATLDSALQKIVQAMRKQHARVEALGRNELIYRFIETRYYAFRNWRTPFGVEWRPPAEVRQRLQTWKPITIPLEGGPSREELRRAYDPRDEFHL